MSLSRQEGGRRSEVRTERQKTERSPLWAEGREVSSKQTQEQKHNADKKKRELKKTESCPTCGLYIFSLWSRALIPALNWLFQLISHVLIRVKTLQETRLFRTENRSSVQTSSWPAAVSTPSFAFLTFHNYVPNYPLLGGLVCMAASKLSKTKQADCVFFVGGAKPEAERTSEQDQKY